MKSSESEAPLRGEMVEASDHQPILATVVPFVVMNRLTLVHWQISSSTRSPMCHHTIQMIGFPLPRHVLVPSELLLVPVSKRNETAIKVLVWL